MGNKCSLSSESCGFACTGYDGSHRWKIIHDTVNAIECDTCRDHAVKSMSGYHDYINAGLGETIYNKQNFKRFVRSVNCAYNAAVNRGECDPL